MTLSIKQRAQLRTKGIHVLIERADGNVKCMTSAGARYYTSQDLAQIAKPCFMDRLTAFMGVRHAAN